MRMVHIIIEFYVGTCCKRPVRGQDSHLTLGPDLGNQRLLTLPLPLGDTYKGRCLQTDCVTETNRMRHFTEPTGASV